MPLAAADNSVCTTVGKYCAFYSPSHRIDCEINTGGYAGPDSVYCKTVQPPQSVQMDNTGVLTCTGQSRLGNAAEGIPTLAYDHDGARPIPLSVIGHRSHLHRHAGSVTISTEGIQPAG